MSKEDDVIEKLTIFLEGMGCTFISRTSDEEGKNEKGTILRFNTDTITKSLKESKIEDVIYAKNQIIPGFCLEFWIRKNSKGIMLKLSVDKNRDQKEKGVIYHSVFEQAYDYKTEDSASLGGFEIVSISYFNTNSEEKIYEKIKKMGKEIRERILECESNLEKNLKIFTLIQHTIEKNK